MPTCSANGTTLYYETAGEHGPPVVLVMGLRARGVAWTPIVERLRRSHRLVFFDHRGVGESAALTGPTNMTEMAGDAVALMDHLGWSTAHLAGVSMGGMGALHAVLDHRARFRSLALVASTSHGRATFRISPTGLWRYLGTMHGTRDQRLLALARILYSREYFEQCDDEALLTRLKLGFGFDHPGTWRAQMGAIAGHDVRDRLSEIDLPALIVGAGQDLLVPEKHAKRLHAGIPHARYMSFPEAGHGVLAEKADDISEAMATLFAQADAGAQVVGG